MKLDLSHLSEEELLRMRICDLHLSINGTWLEPMVQQLYQELEEKGIRHFKPPCYLADEWLTPDSEPVIGIPFYLAHPALIKLERKIMFEAEGETTESCMQLLRHECGHAITYAYRFHKKHSWRQLFGQFSMEYPENSYRFKPYSRSFVQHLADHYAQSHPDEDFAETFAVWLTPNLDWRQQYAGWKALKKLEYVDSTVRAIGAKTPPVKKGKKWWNANYLRSTLNNHYKKRKNFYAEQFPNFHDQSLQTIFSDYKDKKSTAAATLIRQNKKILLFNIAHYTGEKKYVVSQLLNNIITRCRALHLVATDKSLPAIAKISIYATTLIMNHLLTGRFLRQK